jgi:hypothetical protein
MFRNSVGAMAALVAALGLATLIAYGSLGTASPVQRAIAAAGSHTEDHTGTIAITAVDYAFEGVPERVAVGTTFTLVNVSPVEVHELVAIRLAGTETRPAAELIQLPEEELFGVTAGLPTMVLIAPPEAESMAVLGDGSFPEPGRYLLLCFIPRGADPQAYLAAAAAATDGPPQVAGGPPHFVHGMFAEVVVE